MSQALKRLPKSSLLLLYSSSILITSLKEIDWQSALRDEMLNKMTTLKLANSTLSVLSLTSSSLFTKSSGPNSKSTSFTKFLMYHLESRSQPWSWIKVSLTYATSSHQSPYSNKKSKRMFLRKAVVRKYTKNQSANSLTSVTWQSSH